MTEKLFELFCVILMIYSGISMITYAQSKKNGKSSIFNLLEIFEYIEITRKEKGRIGRWFWICLISIGLLILF